MFQYDFMDSMTHQAAVFASNLQYEDIPADVIAIVKRSLRDHYAVAIAGSTQPVNEKLRSFIQEVCGSGEKTVRVIGSCQRFTVERAALINGASGHALDYDDCQDEIHGHPSVVVWTVVITLGELYHISGVQAICAYIAGMEVMCKLCGAIEKTHYGKGWHATGTGGVIGAAIAAAKIMGMDAEDTVNTLSLACSFASGVRGNFGSMAKPVHAGWAAQNGITAAYMTKAGITAAPDILEKKCGFIDCFSSALPDECIHYFSRIGTVYSVLEPGLQIKPFPCVRAAAWPVCAAIDLRKRFPEIRATETIKQVIVTVQPWQNTTMIYPDPQTGLQAKFSGEYCVSRALVYGKLVLSDFRDDAVFDPAVRQMMGKCIIYVAKDMQEYDARPTIIVKMADGREFEGKCTYFLGHKKNPMNEQQHLEKYYSCVSGLIGRKRAEQGASMISNLEQLSDIADLNDLLYPAEQ